MKLEDMNLEMSSQVPRLEGFMAIIINIFPCDRQILSAKQNSEFFPNICICAKRILLKIIY